MSPIEVALTTVFLIAFGFHILLWFLKDSTGLNSEWWA
jgi:hypothetical protein